MYLEFSCKQNNNSSSEVQMPVMDHFDRLPDLLVLVIFNKLGDIKALGRCSAISKRFNSLVPQVEDVVVKVDCVISSEEFLDGFSGLSIGQLRGACSLVYGL